jgi:hypothetical protein
MVFYGSHTYKNTFTEYLTDNGGDVFNILIKSLMLLRVMMKWRFTSISMVKMIITILMKIFEIVFNIL